MGSHKIGAAVEEARGGASAGQAHGGSDLMRLIRTLDQRPQCDASRSSGRTILPFRLRRHFPLAAARPQEPDPRVIVGDRARHVRSSAEHLSDCSILGQVYPFDHRMPGAPGGNADVMM